VTDLGLEPRTQWL